MDKDVLDAIAQKLELDIPRAEQVYGGDINKTFVLQTNSKRLFLKLNDAGKDDMFEKEYKGLELLRTTNAISVPAPVLSGKTGNAIYLVTEYISKGTPARDYWQQFGRQLATLHRNTAERFGLDHDNYIGSLPQKNDQHNSWSEFYAAQRILFLARMAFDEKKCDSTDTKLAEKLCNKLDTLFPPGKPSLIHGDLWSGNYMIGKEGAPVIFDPAVYHGHREMDIGMSLLFGGFDKSFYDHYNEAWPMEKNWQHRVDLTQLYPLLVHLVLFGGHYYHSVRDILRKYN